MNWPLRKIVTLFLRPLRPWTIYPYSNCDYFLNCAQPNPPCQLSCEREPERPGKTHDFRQSVDWLFSHESIRSENRTYELRGERRLLWRLQHRSHKILIIMLERLQTLHTIQFINIRQLNGWFLLNVMTHDIFGHEMAIYETTTVGSLSNISVLWTQFLKILTAEFHPKTLSGQNIVSSFIADVAILRK